MAFKRWMYRGGRPHLFAKIQNRGWAILHSLGIFPERFVTLEVVGKDGKVVKTVPLTARLDSPVEIEYFKNGGILHTVLRQMLKG